MPPSLSTSARSFREFLRLGKGRDRSYLLRVNSWSEFSQFGLVPWKLVLLSICILLFRRPPWIMATWKFTPAIPDRQQALFAGW